MSGDVLLAEHVYRETCSNIRATDDISFKLMGIVPLLSGASFLTFFLKEKVPVEAGPVIVMLSLFAALVTLGLFRWELRNIQTCSWLKRRAEALENYVVTEARVPKQPKPPRGIGKTEAEKWIYSVTVVAWLSIPLMVSQLGAQPSWLISVYIVFAILIVVFTVLSALGDIRVRPGAQIVVCR
jgi:hypothetical protein